MQEVLEQYEEAIKYYNKAVELYPNDTIITEEFLRKI
ncbi:tetratricopeptide repeat protein [Brachyspira murdochii]